MLKLFEECIDWCGVDVCCVICFNMCVGNVYFVGMFCWVISEGERKKREGKRYWVLFGWSEIINVIGVLWKYFDM